MPTAIAVVPNLGSGPKDPLYFVAELRGRIRVVTNDRSVHTFAEGFVGFTPEKEQGSSWLGWPQRRGGDPDHSETPDAPDAA